MEPTRQQPLLHPKVQAALLAMALFALYTAGASRTIYVGDSGELVTAVHLLGIPHPSGYPLYVLLGKLWTLAVPFGSVAFRMSLFSAATAALACAGLYLVGRKLSLGGLSALVAALVLAFSPSFWSQANIQRVYSLNALFVVAATLLVCCFWREKRSRHLIGALFLCGLGASNHLFMGIYATCLFVVVVVSDRTLLRRPGLLVASGAAFLVGLVPYAYLPWRSRANPRLDWGDPESLDGFLGVVFRRDFWDRAWFEGASDLVVVAWDYLGSLGQELTWVGLGLALVGLLVGRDHGRVRLLAVLVMGANWLSMALHGSRVDLFFWHRYYIPSYILAALLAGLGCQRLLASMPRRVGLLVLLLPAVLLVSGFRQHDRSRYRIADSFSRSLLESLPPGAHLVATDDNVLFTLMYLHLVEKVRPDVHLVLQGVGAAHLPPLHFDPERDPAFFTHHPNWNLPQLELRPVGAVFQALRPGMRANHLIAAGDRLEGEDDPKVPKDFLTQNLVGHYHYMLGVTAEVLDWRRARREFRHAADAAPSNDVLFYNLGLIFRRNGWLDEALEAFEHSQAINPRHLASHGRPRASERILELKAEKARLQALERTLEPIAAAAGSPAFHRLRAEQLERHGERVAARGHRLRGASLAVR